MSSLLPLLKSHYSSVVSDQVGSIISSLHVLGEPSLLVDSVTSGLARSIMRPLEGLINGDVSEGLEEGVQGFLGGVVGGVSRSVGTIGEAINDYVVKATTDEEWKEMRSVRRRFSKRATNLEDMAKGVGESAALGFESGTQGVISLYHDGVTMERLYNALLGAVIKPVVGIGDGINDALKAVSDSAPLTANEKRQVRPRRALAKGFDEPVCEEASRAEDVVSVGGTVLDFYSFHLLCPHSLLIGSDECLWMVATDRSKVWVKRWKSVSHYTLESDPRDDACHTLEVHVYEDDGRVSPVSIQVASDDAERLHEEMSRHSHKLGNAVGREVNRPDALKRLEALRDGLDGNEDVVVAVTNGWDCNNVFIHKVQLEVGSVATVDRLKLGPGQTAVIRGLGLKDGAVR